MFLEIGNSLRPVGLTCILLIFQLTFGMLHAQGQGPVMDPHPGILKKAGDRYLLKSKPDSALLYYKKAFLLMKGDKFKKDRAMLFTNMGNAYHYMDKLNESLECSEQSFKLYTEIRDTSGMAKSGCDIGFYYFELRKNSEAFSWITRSVKYAEASKDSAAIGKAYSYMAMLYTEIDDNLDMALEYLLMAEEIFIKLDEPKWINNIKNELAVIYQRQGNFTEAIKIGKELQAWCAQHEMTYEEAVVLHNLGYVYTRMKDYDSSIIYYNQAIEKFSELGDSAWIADEYYSIGLDLISDKKYKEAITVLQRGLGMSKTLGDIKTESRIAQALGEVNEKVGNFEEALKFNQRYFLLRDSLNNKEQSEKLIELKTKFETDRKDKEIALLNKDKQIQIADAGKQRQLKNLFIAGVVLLLLFSLLLINRYKIKKRTAILLAEKNVQIQKEKERAEESEKHKQDFLANMSHEIRTPMNAIIGLTNLLAGKPQDSQSAGYLMAIQHASQNLLRIINDILDLSKIEAGKMQVEHKVFDLSLTLEMMRSMFAPLASEKGIRFEIENTTSIRFVTGDEGKLTQVLTNLIGNALKFTDQGYVKITLKEEGISEREGLFLFEVEDTGIGISSESQRNIFDSFRQAESGQSRKYGGTGLGLTISKKIVESFGGQLHLISQPGKGSVFSFKLKFGIPDASEQKAVPVAKAEDIHGKKFAGRVRILIAEDNTYNQLVAIDTVKKYFPEALITIAFNGEEVLSKLEDHEYNLVFMDVQMPVMDGFEATERIRNHSSETVSKLPVIGLTASVIRSDLEKCIQVGMNAYIPKPFNEHELIDAIIKFSGIKFNVIRLQDEAEEVSVSGNKKYEELFLKLVPQRLDIIEKALPRGDWKTIKDTIHLMRPQLVDSGMKDRDAFFESFDFMDGAISFSEWRSKTKLFCILVRKKIDEMKERQIL